MIVKNRIMLYVTNVAVCANFWHKYFHAEIAETDCAATMISSISRFVSVFYPRISSSDPNSSENYPKPYIYEVRPSKTHFFTLILVFMSISLFLRALKEEKYVLRQNSQPYELFFS